MSKCTMLFLSFFFLCCLFSNNLALSQDYPEAPASTAKGSPQGKSCPTPFIKDILPRAATAGTKLTITGFGFGSIKGTVIFPGTVQAEIISWYPQHIVVVVPKGTQDGHVAVINGCSGRSKDGAGGYFKIITPGK